MSDNKREIFCIEMYYYLEMKIDVSYIKLWVSLLSGSVLKCTGCKVQINRRRLEILSSLYCVISLFPDDATTGLRYAGRSSRLHRPFPRLPLLRFP